MTATAFGIGRKTRTTDAPFSTVRAEVAEWIGMATLDDGIGFRRERSHCAVPSERERMRQVPASGTRSQSGPMRELVFDFIERLLQQKKSRRRSAASADCGQSLVSVNDDRYAAMNAAAECFAPTFERAGELAVLIGRRLERTLERRRRGIVDRPDEPATSRRGGSLAPAILDAAARLAFEIDDETSSLTISICPR
jgi:hypothetical protein